MSAFSENLYSLLKTDLADIEQLQKALASERTAISSRSVTDIKRITEQKQLLLQSLDQRAKQKAQLIAQSGLGIRPGQVEASISKLNDEKLIALWRKTRSALEACKEKNKTNGLMISRSLQRTNKLMSIIRGQAKAPKLYGHQGKETNFSSQQHLGKA